MSQEKAKAMKTAEKWCMVGKTGKVINEFDSFVGEGADPLKLIATLCLYGATIGVINHFEEIVFAWGLDPDKVAETMCINGGVAEVRQNHGKLVELGVDPVLIEKYEEDFV